MEFSPNDLVRDFSRLIKEGEPFGINFVGKTVCDSSFHVQRENSEIMSFEYIVDGEGSFEIDSKTYTPKRGDVFLLTEGSTHRYYVDKERPWRKYFVSFVGPLATKLKELYLPYDVYLFEASELKENFERILEIAFDTENNYENIKNEVLIEIVKIMVFLRGNAKKKTLSLPELIKEKIDALIENDFSLETISKEFNYSKNHIINVFKEKYGETPYQYYIESKLEIAKRYLRETSCSIADIAHNLSFTDSQYFSVSFKKMTGMTPREFRAKNNL